jgi:hypothetical protein
MIDLKYGPLFSVELLHKYAGNQSCNDFTVVPSLLTQQILNNYRIVVKQYDNVLYGYMDLDPAALALHTPLQKPLIVPGEGPQLTFFLLLNNPLFFNYTSIRTANNNGNVYYFSNRNNNISSNKKFLTRGDFPGYDLGATYSYEELVVDGGICYQSVRGNNSGNLLTDNNSWRKTDLDPHQLNRFVSSEDLLSWLPSISQFPYSASAATFDVTITGLDVNGNGIAITKTINNPDKLPSFPLDLSGIGAGKYLLSINDTTPPPPIPIYLNDELSNKGVFGIIDIFFQGTSDDYRILDTDNILQSPVYSLYFLNRATIWKYILTSTKNDAVITDSNNNYFFTTIQQPLPPPPQTPTTILSQFPIPLTETPLTLKLDNQITSPPCASPNRLAIGGSDQAYYSEIFLNY